MTVEWPKKRMQERWKARLWGGSQQGFDPGTNLNLTFDPNISGQTFTENGPLVSKKNTGELTFITKNFSWRHYVITKQLQLDTSPNH